MGGGAAPVLPWYIRGVDVPLANCVGAYQAIGAISKAASYINLANPGTYTLTDASPGHEATWNAADGWTGNAADVYTTLVTGIVPADGTWSILVRYSNASANTWTLFGNASAAPSMSCKPIWVDNKTYMSNGDGGSGSFTPGAAGGVVAIAGRHGFLDGALKLSSLGPWSGSPTATIHLLGMPAAQAFGGKIQAAAIYNITLTDVQVATISTAMAALPL
jgi:hypothetical protein